MHKYKLLGKKGEGTFSAVLKAQCTTTDRSVAIKCMKNQFESVDQVNRLREIQALRRLSPHPNIIKLFEVLYDRSTGRLALVFELMEMDLYELIKGRKQYLPEDKVLHTMYQLMRAVEHMHRNGIFHRDIKPENVLVSGDTLKLADFGSCRGIYSRQPFTEYIATRWYRAPECLLTDGYYNYKMDLWGAGCVFFEIVALYPLFPGTTELDQLHKIHKVLGTPPGKLLNKLRQNSSQGGTEFPAEDGVVLAELIPHAPPEAVDLIRALLEYDPDQRVTAKKAVRHPYFKEIRELDRQLRTQAKQAERLEKERQQQQQQQPPSPPAGAAAGATAAAAAAAAPPSSSSTPLDGLTPQPPPPQLGDGESLPSLHLGSSVTGRQHNHNHHNNNHNATDADASCLPRHPHATERKMLRREREKEKEKEPPAPTSHLPSIDPKPSFLRETVARKGSVDCLTSLPKQHLNR